MPEIFLRLDASLYLQRKVVAYQLLLVVPISALDQMGQYSFLPFRGVFLRSVAVLD